MYLEYAEVNNTDLKHVKSRTNYLKGYFGENKDINNILPKDVENFKLHLLGRSLANATVNRYISVLQKMFNIAIANDLLLRNPCRNMKKLVEDNEKTRYLLPQEEIELYKIMPKWLAGIVTVALHTGLRKTNIRLLEWTSLLKKESKRKMHNELSNIKPSFKEKDF